MTVLEYIHPEHLDAFQFWDSDIVVIDGNIGEKTLAYVLSRTEKCKHVVYEPISVEKSERILKGDFLAKITMFKPNLV
jgi:hypothetical protein